MAVNFNNNYQYYDGSVTLVNGEVRQEEDAMLRKADTLRVIRLMIEAIECAFFLCNAFLEYYGVQKIFDIVNQILPTAFVLNTGYWAFYNNVNGNSLCICNKFGMKCPHSRNPTHFITLDEIEDNFPHFFVHEPYSGKLFPAEVNVKVTPIESDMLRAYEIETDLYVNQLQTRQNGFRFYGNRMIHINAESRYIITPEYYDLRNTVLKFTPHPMNHVAFSSYFDNMQRFSYLPQSFMSDMQLAKSYTIVLNNNVSFSYDFYNCFYPFPHRYQVPNSVNIGDFEVNGSNIWTHNQVDYVNAYMSGEELEKAYENTMRFLTYYNKRVVNIGHPRDEQERTPNLGRRSVMRWSRDQNVQAPNREVTARKRSKRNENTPTSNENVFFMNYESDFPELPPAHLQKNNKNGVVVLPRGCKNLQKQEENTTEGLEETNLNGHEHGGSK